MSLLLAAVLLLGGRCPYVYESASPACNDGDVRNGYWAGVWWVPRFITLDEWWFPQPEYSYGRAVWYAPGVMEANAWLRWEWGQLPKPPSDYLDGVALMSPDDIGKTVWLRRPGHDWEGPFIVVDCAQRDDLWWIVERRREVVEVGWETKVRWEMDAPLDGVEVVVAETAEERDRILYDHTRPLNYPLWTMWRLSGESAIIQKIVASPLEEPCHAGFCVGGGVVPDLRPPQ